VPSTEPPQRTDPFFALSDPTRRGLLDQLIEGEQSVTRLSRPFSVSQPAISQHLRILHDARLVQVRRVGRHRLYRLDREGMEEVHLWLERYRRFWDDRLAALGRFLDDQADGGDP
jgi:DNA-binding transcriptional ArsR family regulator